MKTLKEKKNRQRPEDKRRYTKPVCFTLNIIKQGLNFTLLMVDESFKLLRKMQDNHIMKHIHPCRNLANTLHYSVFMDFRP